MKKIDQETVQRILDAADIVEVVSDFVTLKRRGANYIGLCPFHNERTPSFSVSRAKGICKCFSCGKGGSAVGFVMAHEQMNYNEALRYLAKKYHIEIKEHEMSPEEQQAETERESMLALNDFALEHFCHNLTDTEDGRAIGLSYFRERGINDLMIKRFRLGYALDKYDDLVSAAKAKGFNEKFLLDTGLCAQSERTGRVYDKYKGRVIYPIFSVSGRVIGFGGRTLSKDKGIAKYVNSKDSVVYDKSRELYGLYQAKSAIAKKDKCILVEGYMDVISMHQVGIENVVASSGTSLTYGQIRLIHRFTNNITVIYDADPAGIHASFRAIDMLLGEGMNIKVLLLPEGDDPDSYAQHHSSSEVEAYIAEHETDFIRFKTHFLLAGAKDDPMARARGINDIIASIAVIPDAIARTEYIKQCSRMFDIAENTLMLQLNNAVANNMLKREQPVRQGRADGEQQAAPTEQQQATITTDRAQNHVVVTPAPRQSNKMTKYEQEIVKYVVRYGMAQLWEEEDGTTVTVLDFVQSELDNDGITLTHPTFNRILEMSLQIARERWPEELNSHKKRLIDDFNRSMEAGREEIRQNANDLADIEARERRLNDACSEVYAKGMDEFATSYLESILISCSDDEVRTAATNLVYEPYTLSKVHTRYAHVETERERLTELVPRSLAELKLGILNERIAQLQARIRTATPDILIELLTQQKELYDIRAELAKYLGERIVTPK